MHTFFTLIIAKMRSYKYIYIYMRDISYQKNSSKSQIFPCQKITFTIYILIQNTTSSQFCGTFKEKEIFGVIQNIIPLIILSETIAHTVTDCLPTYIHHQYLSNF